MPLAKNHVRRVSEMAVAVAVLLGAGTAAAHHGWGSYDSDRPITITGPITSVSFEQPHVQMRVDAGGTTWTVILAPISRMQSRGATDAVVQVGRSVAAYGYPRRDGVDEMRAERITIDGRTFELR